MTKPHTQATRLDLLSRFPLALRPRRTPKIPLKIGIDKDIIERCPDINPKRIRWALADYTAGFTYLTAMVYKTDRVDLDGNVCGKVDKNAARLAKEKLTRLQTANKS